MITRRDLLTGAATIGAAAGLTALSGCSTPRHDPDQITLWGVSGAQQLKPQQQVIDAFLKAHAGVRVDVKNVPTNGQAGDATSVITAVRGGTAPDLWWMDRFTGAQFAALGLLEPIDDLIEKYESPGFLSGWLPFAVNELTYQGQHYGLPTYTDARGLIYNRTLLRQAGVDLDEFVMANGPMTIQRVLEIADKLTVTDARNNYTQMGFVPWHLQGAGYTWSVGTHAQYFDNARCELTMTSDAVVRAFQFMYDYAQQHDFSRVDAFVKSYEQLNGPAGQSAFSAGKLAMDISQSSISTQIKKYAPDLDWGYTHLPIFSKGDPAYTWCGGFSVVMPKGSSRSAAAWQLMKHIAGSPGQSVFCPATTTLPTRRDVFDLPSLKDRIDVINQLSYATSRPPLPVGALWWQSLLDATNSVTVGSATPTDALARAQARVEGQMDAYCPFSLPTDYGKTGL